MAEKKECKLNPGKIIKERAQASRYEREEKKIEPFTFFPHSPLPSYYRVCTRLVYSTFENGILCPIRTSREFKGTAGMKRDSQKRCDLSFLRLCIFFFSKQIAACEFVLYFECSPETMKERLLARAETSGRVDDNEDTIRKRLETFENQTKPVIDYYESQNKVKKVVMVYVKL